MTQKNLLSDYHTHFSFGKNWESYAKNIREHEINEAEKALRTWFGPEGLKGKRFLDIGCGSGLHSLAALRLGASEILAVDLDPYSVNTTRAVFEHFANHPAIPVRIEEKSVFDLDPNTTGTFDVVYSWGVLHHTGNLHLALQKAAAMIAPKGILAVALYRKTWLCPFWKKEKKWYTHTSPHAQKKAQSVFIGLMRVAFWVLRRDFKAYVAHYSQQRGMDYHHDVHDWLGGYPYESISPKDLENIMHPLGFRLKKGPLQRRQSSGLFGSGCDEYLFEREVFIK